MWFVFNIIGIIICVVTRLFCQITTFKVLKYDKFEEVNPIVRKLLNCRNGKILVVIFVYSGPITLLTLNFILQILDSRFIWMVAISILIILPVFIYDFLNDVICFFRDYRGIKSELSDDKFQALIYPKETETKEGG